MIKLPTTIGLALAIFGAIMSGVVSAFASVAYPTYNIQAATWSYIGAHPWAIIPLIVTVVGFIVTIASELFY